VIAAHPASATRREMALTDGVTILSTLCSTVEIACSPEDWVLDIGCGDGFLTRAIADLVPGGPVLRR
jgi:2-polyprenyl-3-methyl-5-hydroxy-6-metoxy-1,4-benzoquinol methylase